MGTKERRIREKTQRRREILTAARELFRELGFQGTTMPKIARKAELAPGTLYLYFPGKESLYVELLIEGYTLLTKALQTLSAQTTGQPRDVEALIERFFSYALEHTTYFDIIFFVVQRERKGVLDIPVKEEQKLRLRASQENCLKISADILAGAGAHCGQGGPLKTIDSMWAMLAGVVLYYVKAGPEAFTAASEETSRMIMAALFPNQVT